MREAMRRETRSRGPTGARTERSGLVATRAAASGQRQAKFFLGSLILHAVLGLVLVWLSGVLSPAAGPPILVRMVEEEEHPATPKRIDVLDVPPVPHVMVDPLPPEEPSAAPTPEILEVLLKPPDTPPPRRPRRVSVQQHVRIHAPSAKWTLLPPMEVTDDGEFALRAEEMLNDVTQTGRALHGVAPERYAALPPAESRGSEAGYLRNPKPQYPRVARERGYEGDVLLKVLVLHDGTVGDISVHHSSGYEVLDRAALDAVKEWLFVPASRDGVPVARWAIVPVKFRLP